MCNCVVERGRGSRAPPLPATTQLCSRKLCAAELRRVDRLHLRILCSCSGVQSVGGQRSRSPSSPSPPTLLRSSANTAAEHAGGTAQYICRIKPSSQGLQSPRIQILLEGNSKYVTAVFFFNYCTIVMRSCVQCWQSLQHSGASGAQGRDLTNSTRLPARGL